MNVLVLVTCEYHNGYHGNHTAIRYEGLQESIVAIGRIEGSTITLEYYLPSLLEKYKRGKRVCKGCPHAKFYIYYEDNKLKKEANGRSKRLEYYSLRFKRDGTRDYNQLWKIAQEIGLL